MAVSVINLLNSEPTSYAFTGFAGWEFQALGQLKVVGYRAKTRSSYTGSVIFGTAEGVQLASSSVSFVADEWVEGLFSDPITLTSGVNYVVMINGNNSTLFYGSNPSLNIEQVSFVRGRYGSFPGTQESGIYYSVDLLIEVNVPPIPWEKEDGGYILIKFTDSLTGTIEGNETHFSVGWNEYTYAPDGTPTVHKTGSIRSIFSGNDDTEIAIEMAGNKRFNNAAGSITVTYDGSGTLQGAGGPVEAFEVSFTPTGLLMKPNQHPVEHIEISNSMKTSNLIRVYYSNGYLTEHVDVYSASWTGTLINIEDI